MFFHLFVGAYKKSTKGHPYILHCFNLPLKHFQQGIELPNWNNISAIM